MLTKLKSKLQSDDNKRLLSNFFSLSVLQMMNYILPLIVIPYLFTTLGSEKFGLIAFAQVVVVYFSLFVNYGFNLTATKEISVHRDNAKKISEIYSTVTTIKVIFSIIAFSIFTIMVFSIDKFSADWKLYLLTFGTMIEYLFFPIWFFQGMERMKYITIIYTFSKIIVTVLIFIVIKSADDYLMVPVLYMIGSATSGVLALYVIFNHFKITFMIPTAKKIIFQIRDGWHLFISNASINIYRNANILILGLLSTTQYVGYYALVEKIIRALQGLMNPVSEALYPYMSKRSATQTLHKTLQDILEISKYYSIILIIISTCILVFSPFIVYVLGGSYFESAILDMRILSTVIVFGGLNYLFGVIGLVSLGYKKYFMKSTLIVGIINVTLCFLFIPILQDAGAAIALAISELVLLLTLLKKISFLHKYKDKQHD